MLKHLNHYALAIGLLINSSAFSSTRHIGDRLLEGVLPSRNLPLKRLPADFFPKYNHGEIVKHMKNGGFLVRNLLREEKSIAGFHEILPIKKPKLLRLPKSFFPESRDDVLVKRIDGRTLFVRENRQVERSRELYKRTANKLGLLGKKDRRVVVPDPLVLPFSGISLLRLTYSLFPGTQFVFYGTGFRNGVNQLLTAGHNLKLEESEIKDLCHEEGISLKNYSFKKNNYEIDVIFGLQGNSHSGLHYTYLTKLNAKDAYTHPKRDFGVLSLPAKDARFLDESIGALGLTLLPDLPKEYDMYLDRSVMVVGYPGEKNPLRMYMHSGKIKWIDVNGVVSYTADTTPGNSGSPGFLLKSKKSQVSSACLVHTHQAQKLNAGEKMDDDLMSFMTRSM